ncbi:MAG: permease [Bacillota bacterium]|jgi:uncharacterized membrane protein YraQ (UPF0718 family)|nr:permease [Eubacteriales bacterium]MDI9491795.1 permease [Bacillota bacterium]NLV70187.1 permease [Clostridiales bacterium]HRV32716.1 permease [Anaerovoracaceae bacterium]MDD4286218.1 permease [Eubacteriales bacterium]
MYTYALYIAALAFLGLSFSKDRAKTRQALKKTWTAFENILPQFLSVLMIIGILLSVLNPEVISQLIGQESGIAGMTVAAVVGSITLIPGFVAFPLAASLLEAGAGYGQIAMFVTTLMMVGVVTLPVESRFFGRRLAVRRNVSALIFCVLTAWVMGGILG